jgi:hypothetical protein
MKRLKAISSGMIGIISTTSVLTFFPIGGPSIGSESNYGNKDRDSKEKPARRCDDRVVVHRVRIGHMDTYPIPIPPYRWIMGL